MNFKWPGKRFPGSLLASERVDMLILKITISLIFLIGSFGSQAWAQAEPEMGIDKTTPGVVQQKKVKTRAQDYVRERGWQQGENTKKDGSLFFVAIGIGTNTMTPSDPGWVGGRTFAFDEALLRAKAKLAEFIGMEISTSLKRDYERNMGNAPKNEETETVNVGPSIPDDSIGKMTLLLNASLDQALAKQGIKPDSPAAPAAIKKFLREKSMEKAIEAVAKARVSGVQVAKVFESKGDGKKGQIAVIAIQSDKLKRMADAIASENYSSIPLGNPKKPILDQVPTDPAVLSASFGVQQTRDENGRYVLVSYGQSFPFIPDDEDELEMAADAAQLEAEAGIRSFAGENVSVLKSSNKSTSLQTLAENMESRQFNQQDKKSIESIAKSLKISGMRVLTEEEIEHPFTGKQMVVSVVTWSPEGGTSARSLGQRMKEPTTQNSGSGDSGQWGKGDYGSGYQAEGADVDEEDF